MGAYTDDELMTAIAKSRSWRGVLRSLGLHDSSGAAARSAKQRAEALGVRTEHFTGQRRWSDQDLVTAVASSTTWREVAERLGTQGGSSTAILRGHCVRLAVDSSHIETGRFPASAVTTPVPLSRLLPRAGALLAAAWYELCGIAVPWPLEPRPFDLVTWAESAPRRVQVKTTRSRAGSSTWQVKLSSETRAGGTYDPADIDDLFIIDANGGHYLMPFEHVAGLQGIHLSAYEAFRVQTLWG